MFGPLGFWTMAPLRCAAKFDPFLSLDCAPTPSTLAQSKERKGSNFAIWQPCRGVTSAAPSVAKVDYNHNTIAHPGHNPNRMGGRKQHNSSFNVTEELCEFQVAIRAD